MATPNNKGFRTMRTWSSRIGMFTGLLAVVLIWTSGDYHYVSWRLFAFIGLCCLVAVASLLVWSCCLMVSGSNRTQKVFSWILAILLLLLSLWLLFKGIDFLTAAWQTRNFGKLS